jgi:serine/threonine protein kinase/tetratricopeptide (TPR) repeat protein
MEDPKSKKTGPQGIGVPAKGDSSAGNTSFDPDGATISDAPSSPPTRPPAATSPPPTPPPPKPSTRVVNPDATLADSMADAPADSVSTSRPLSGIYMKEAILQPGDLIGARYEILLLLGEGGMGAVYKALDREVDRTVALKLIRPELASNPTILARFKQELLTAHQVTHKNVIRIYDISEADGVKFITMEFVEGDDLRRILTKEGKLPTERAVEIIRQVCLALEAAHGAGVIHRDLKPQNIMQETKTGRILVMDFGLARTIGGDGMTQTGALLGTIEYMSPEQSMGKSLDQRSDIFAVGLIFYELLIGKTPYKADTAMASLLKRNQERAIPAAELDATVPKGLSDIVSKCLERDLEHRYQNVQEILHDLDAFQGARPTLASITLPAPVLPPKPTTPWKWIGIGALALLVVAGGWAFRSGVFHSGSSGSAEVKGPELSLAILPFQNSTGDPSLDQWGSNLADMLTTAVGQSAHLRIVSPDRLNQVLSDLRITPGAAIDPSNLQNIAKFSNADTVVWGKYFKNGDKIRIQGTVRDLKQEQDSLVSVEAANQNDITAPVNQLADQIRQHLTISSDAQKELKASSFQPTSKSPAALSAYMQGLQMRRQGKNLEAVKLFQTAVQDDPQFALAFSRLAETNSALGYDPAAEQASRKAVELDSQLPLGEKYLIEANHARVMKDNKKALETYEKLAANAPGDTDVQFALGGLYLDTGQFDKARAQYAKVLKNDPRNLTALLQTGWLEVTNGKPQAGLEPLNKAMSLAIELDNDEQKAQVFQALGVAYDGLNKYDEALRSVQQSLDINKRLGNKAATAGNYAEMGDLNTYLGKPEAALASYNEALKLRKEIGAKKEAANVLISIGSLYEDRGEYDKALDMYKESLQTQRDVGDASLQAVCLNNIANVYLAKGQSEDALTYYQQALQLREKLNNPADTADTLHDLGEAYTKTAQYDQAMNSYMHALQLRRSNNDAHNVALDQHSMGMVFQYQGRFGASVSNLNDSVQGFRTAKDHSRIMAQVLIDYADALARAGRGDEVGKALEEAQTLATDLKNDKLIADVHNTQGDLAFFSGDNKTAKEQYQQALQLATRAKAPETVLISRLNLARVGIAEGRSAAVVNDLRSISQEADKQGMKYLALVSSVDLGAAMINNKDYARAQDVLNQALNTSEKLGTRMQTALIHYQLGNLLKQKGDKQGATAEYGQASSLLDDIRKEQGAEKVLQRADLKTVYNASKQGSTGA